ncbi:MAG: hypothetical protein ACYC3I_26535, partial [Gemmataceae bacterium]
MSERSLQEALLLDDRLAQRGHIGRNFSFSLKTGAAVRLSGSYTGKHEHGTSRDWARSADASGRDV